MLSVELNNMRLLCELHEYFSSHGEKYCDICLSSKAGLDLCEKVRSSEINFFRKLNR
jgi:hypothetical protein